MPRGRKWRGPQETEFCDGPQDDSKNHRHGMVAVLPHVVAQDAEERCDEHVLPVLPHDVRADEAEDDDDGRDDFGPCLGELFQSAGEADGMKTLMTWAMKRNKDDG